MRKIKVLFLDIDGVLNSMDHNMSWLPAYGNWAAVDEDINDKFDQRCVNWLLGIINLTGCELVISSTWRNHRRHGKHVSFEDTWKKRKMPKFLDKTPNGEGIRGQQIEAWLQNTKYNVTDYCIIDDDSDMLKEQLPYFVQTNSDLGITEKEFTKVIKILGIKRKVKNRKFFENFIQNR